MDTLILHALSDRHRYRNLLGAVPTGMLTQETQAMLSWMQCYYSAFPEHKNVNWSEMESLVRLRSGNATPDQIAITLHLINQMQTPASPESLQGIVGQLYELDLSGKAGALVSRYNAGEELDLSYELQALSAETRRSIMDGTKPSWANEDISVYLAADTDEGGLQWSTFPQLKAGLRGLQKVDNVALAMPTDKGKTSLLCRLAIDFQRQAKTLYPDQNLLYLVNEGTAERITTRMYQTAVGVSRAELGVLAQSGKLNDMYASIVGRRDSIRVANIHGKGLAQVSGIIEQHNAHTVITDMTGRIRAPSNRGGGMNDIGQLEEVWNGMREMATLQEFAHIGTVQVSAEGFDMLYPPISAMQNSKTGIQTTLDLVIMGGALINPAMAMLRGISTPKNKLARSGQPGLNMFEAYFTPEANIWEVGVG